MFPAARAAAGAQLVTLPDSKVIEAMGRLDELIPRRGCVGHETVGCLCPRIITSRTVRVVVMLPESGEASLEDVVQACRQLRMAQAGLRLAIEQTDRVLLAWLTASGLSSAEASRTAQAALLEAGWTPDDVAHAGVGTTGVLARRAPQRLVRATGRPTRVDETG